MSFGSELKDFVSGFKTGADVQEQMGRKKYYEAYADRMSKADANTFDFNGEKQKAMGVPVEHSTLHNVGHWLGLNQDERDQPQAVRIGSANSSYNYDPSNPLPAANNMQEYGYGQTYDDPLQRSDLYSRGGMVRAKGYAVGGFVDDEPEADGPPTQLIPGNAVPAAPVAAAPPAQAAPPPDTTKQALHAGLMTLQARNGLSAQGVPTEQTAAGQKRLFSGADAASPEDYQAAAKAVDPDGTMSDAQLNLQIMKKGYEFYMTHNEPQKAANYAAMIIQYSGNKAAELGQKAAQQLQGGDVQGGVQSLKMAADQIPNGTHPADIKVNQDGTVSLTQVDTQTGKPIDQHQLSGQQLINMALGLANKSGYYQQLMQSAQAAQGYAAAPSDAYMAAQQKLAGINPDGSLPDDGSAAAPAAGQSAVPITPTGNRAAAPAPVAAQAPRSNNPLAIGAPLPEDVPAQPAAVSRGSVLASVGPAPSVPKPPPVMRVDPADTVGMSPKERAAYVLQVGQANKENRAAFLSQMSEYRAKAAEYRQMQREALATASAGVTKAGKAPADPKLALKDRSEVVGQLDAAAPKEDPAFKSMPEIGQKAEPDVAYDLYTHNDLTPARAHNAAMQLLSPNMQVVNGKMKINVPFTFHQMPNDKVRIVFKTGDKMVIPKNSMDQIAAAWGSQHYKLRSEAQNITADQVKQRALNTEAGRVLERNFPQAPDGFIPG